MAFANVLVGKADVEINGTPEEIYSTIALLAEGDAPVIIVKMTSPH